jgi:hypothetical protein
MQQRLSTFQRFESAKLHHFLFPIFYKASSGFSASSQGVLWGKMWGMMKNPIFYKALLVLMLNFP